MNKAAKRSILLVGNGPNHFSGDWSWESAVRFAAHRVRLQNAIEPLLKEPLPLVYERITAQPSGLEQSARASLAKKLKRMRPNDIHTQLMRLNWPVVFTTNYDSCLERSIGEFTQFGRNNLAPEKKYSLFRRYASPSQSVWHIHGDCERSASMMLGLDHYAGSLQKLRRYFTEKRDGSPFKFGHDPRAVESQRHSWADLFVRDDVHIVGLGLSYSEIPLWWLISQKHALKNRGHACGHTYYYQMGIVQEPTRLRLLQEFGVTIRCFDAELKKPTRQTWAQVLNALRQISGGGNTISDKRGHDDGLLSGPNISGAAHPRKHIRVSESAENAGT